MARKIINATLVLVLVVATTTLTFAQAPSSGEAEPETFVTQLQFVGQESYDVNGTKGTRYKLSVTNRATHPDFLWQPIAQRCGKNENASRTWVEVFGSPGDKRLAGFCGLRSSEDLGHLWFPVQSGEKGPQCVYIVMTDRQTGRKYISNRVCSRSFTVMRGTLTGGDPSAAPARHKRDEWIEITSFQSNQSAVNVNGGSGSDRIFNASNGSTVRRTDSGVPIKKVEGTSGDTSVSREQVAAFIMRGLGETKLPHPASQRFADVPPSSPFFAYIDRVAELGIVQGCSRNKFCPAEPVARGQMAVFIVRATGTSNPPTPAKQRFADVPPTYPSYAFIDLAASRKLIAGCGGNNFCPKEPVTRDEAAAALRKAFPSK